MPQRPLAQFAAGPWPPHPSPPMVSVETEIASNQPRSRSRTRSTARRHVCEQKCCKGLRRVRAIPW